MRSYETHPGVAQQNTTDAIRHASERVTLACRALAAASNELRVVRKRSGMTPVEEAADMVAAEAERVCEMADDLAKLAIKLGRQTLSTAARAG
jgi:hypothetical protein